MANRNLAETVRTMQGRKRKSGRAPAKTRAVRPTDEFTAKNDTQSAGMAVRVVPVIDTLKARGQIDSDQHAILNHYRDQALLAQQPSMRDSCDFSVRGGTSANGPSMAVTSAKVETSRLEGFLGPLVGICRSVVRDDHSLRQWCIDTYGSVTSGNRVRPVNEKSNMADALGYLCEAAKRMKK